MDTDKNIREAVASYASRWNTRPKHGRADWLKWRAGWWHELDFWRRQWDAQRQQRSDDADKR